MSTARDPTHAHELAPSPWIARFAHLVPEGAHVLDLASGAGRHARHFAQRRCKVLAVDRDADLLAQLRDVPRVTTEAADLEGGDWPFTGRRFDAIVVTNYLHRPLFAPIAAALESDGVLLYETFAAGNEAFGRPARRDFLLEPGELLAVFGAILTVVAFEQGEARLAEHPAVVQRLAAVGRARAWPPPLQSGTGAALARKPRSGR